LQQIAQFKSNLIDLAGTHCTIEAPAVHIGL
jgi:hypothetical protein